MLTPVIFIVGPTGSGKSRLALMLARKLKAEIISADSMQIYRGMDIGTAKPTRKEQRIIPHHLLSKITSRSECSVFKYQNLALKALQKIIRRRHLPIVVGGSGLYIKALIDGLSPLPGKQVQYRKQLEKMDAAQLHERLKKINLNLASTIHVNNKKRLIRTLEIIETPHPNLPPSATKRGEIRPQSVLGRIAPTFAKRHGGIRRIPPKICGGQGGKESSRSISSSLMGKDKGGGLFQFGFTPVIFGLNRDRKELYERIEKRVDQMFSAGWIHEVKRLRKTGLSKTAQYAIGYKEILEYLEGDRSEEEVKSEIKKRTRHLAKKQMTWFRRDERIKWYFVAGEKYSSASREILKKIRKELVYAS